MIVGAGTVMEPTITCLAIMAGAQFIVANCALTSCQVCVTCIRFFMHLVAPQ